MKKQDVKNQILEFVEYYYSEVDANLRETKTYTEPPVEAFEKISELGIPREGNEIGEMVNVLKEDVFPYRIVGEHPRSFAFVPAPAKDVSKLGEIMTTMYNPNAAGWFSAPIVAHIHRTLIRWLCGRVGFGEGSDGVFVSGGSLANLTGIIAGRNAKLDIEQIHKGVAYVSAQAHHSVNKGLRMVGIPDSRIRAVEIDEDFRIRPEALDKMIREDKANGLIPFMVIATAGTTNSGIIDPLEEIGAVCAEHDIWFHVDGAFGASVLVSDKYKHLLKGIETADSVIWDAHKWLFQTYTSALILVKDRQNLLNSFSDNPSYLKDASESEELNSWDLGPELSRPAFGVKLWLTLQTLGTDAIEADINHSIELIVKLEEEVTKYPNWEVVTKAQLAMVTFRYVDENKSEEELNEINVKIAHEIQSSGWANILTTEIGTKKVIRISSISPDATEEDMIETMAKLNDYALQIVGA